jgi:hypothetical protein
MVAKLEQSKKDTNHKIKILQQQHRRSAGIMIMEPQIHVVDFSNVPNEKDGKTNNDLRTEIVLMKDRLQSEENRLSKLLIGCGRGRGKSPEFEFATRTILATGCSARAAKDNLLIGARLFLPAEKYAIFEAQVPGERWFREQRKGLGYEAWLHSMIIIAKCESILQWGVDETRYSQPQPFIA